MIAFTVVVAAIIGLVALWVSALYAYDALREREFERRRRLERDRRDWELIEADIRNLKSEDSIDRELKNGPSRNENGESGDE